MTGEATSALELPATVDEITPAYLTAVLRAGGMIGDDMRVVAVACEQIAVGAAMLGQLARLHLQYTETGTPPASSRADREAPPGGPTVLVAKLPTTAPDNRALGTSLRLYEREARFYLDLATQVPLRTPACYGAQIGTSGDAAILLEDLGAWSAPSQVTGADLAHAHRAVAALAGLHAAWWGSPGLDHLGWLPRFDEPRHLPLGDLYRGIWPSFVEKFAAHLPPGAVELGRAAQGQFEDVLRAATEEAPITLVHGDFRLDNMFFEPGGTDPDRGVAALDWQGVHRGPGIEDVSMFVTQSLPIDLRREHEHDLVRAWHERLSALVGDGLDYPFSLAWEHYRRMALFSTVYPVIVAGSWDLGNQRGRDLFTATSIRAFTAALDLDAGQFLD